MKKFLPIILFIVGLFVVLGAIIFVARSRDRDEEIVEDEVALIEVSPVDRPILSLTPREDGHWLDLKIAKLGRFESMTMDYELLYKLPDGRTQGVPGTVRMNTVADGETNQELLLGSESSGNFRYDEGVTGGTLTLRFRNEKGKLLAKFESEFTLSSDTDELKSVDGSIAYMLDESDENYFVVMNTIGHEDNIPGELEREPFGIFSSSEDSVPGNIKMDNLYRWDNQWEAVTDGDSPDIGKFVQLKAS